MNLVNQLHSPAVRPKFNVQSSEDFTTVSELSMFSAMERFVSAVDKMDKVVMIPCKLMDMSVSEKDDTAPPSISSESDLHSVYQMLLSLRKELNFGSSSGDSSVLVPARRLSSLHHRRKGAHLTKINLHANTNNSKRIIKPVRFSSNLSLSSLESVSSDLSEYENDTDSDSGKQSEDSDTQIESPSQLSPSKASSHDSLADTFRMHLSGLYSTLDQLTASAEYVSSRYETDVGCW